MIDQLSGSLSFFEILAARLPLALKGQSNFAQAGRLYCVGGDAGEGPHAQVYVAGLYRGELGTWQRLADLPVKVLAPAVGRWEDNLYVAGLESGQVRIQRAKLLDEGGPGAWQDCPVPQPSPLAQNLRLVAARHHLIAVDGRRLCLATIQADGSLGPWSEAGILPLADADGCVAELGGRLWALGGPPDGVYGAPLLDDGGLGSWVEAPSVAPAWSGQWQTPLAAHGRLFMVGGSRSGQPNHHVLSADLTSAGELQHWCREVSLPAPRCGGATVFVHGYLFHLGGEDRQGRLSPSIFRAPQAQPPQAHAGQGVPRTPAASPVRDGVMPWGSQGVRYEDPDLSCPRVCDGGMDEIFRSISG